MCTMFLLTACTNQQIMNTLGTVLDNGEGGAGGISTMQIIKGLKEALTQGIDKGASQVSVKDGYLKNNAIKILLPDEAKKVANKLRNIPGFNNVEGNLIEKFNRAAENAAKSAKPIFVNAITNMTIQDAKSILMGEDNAATNYLRRTTSTELYDSFSPVVKRSLNRVKGLEYWKDVATTYNQLPFNQEKVDSDINDYVTNKAMDGLFSMIEKEEKQIRKDPIQRTTELLKKVFSLQDQK